MTNSRGNRIAHVLGKEWRWGSECPPTAFASQLEQRHVQERRLERGNMGGVGTGLGSVSERKRGPQVNE